MIDSWRQAVVRAAPFAPRFRVAPGECLVIDNVRDSLACTPLKKMFLKCLLLSAVAGRWQYRMLHARDPFVGGRVMFRVQCWTDMRHYSALPAPCLCGCGAPYFMQERMRGTLSVSLSLCVSLSVSHHGLEASMDLESSHVGIGSPVLVLPGFTGRKPVCTHHNWIKAPPPERANDRERWFKEIMQPYDRATDAALSG